MLHNRDTHTLKRLTRLVLIIFFMMSVDHTLAAEPNPPPRCDGFGALQSISLTDWESGLGAWTVDTHDVANPISFDTLNWAVVGSLPDSRAGNAAFVADQDNGDCVTDTKAGALTLDSPTIVIPGGTQVPRISIDHPGNDLC